MSVVGWKLMAVVFQPAKFFIGTYIVVSILEFFAGSDIKCHSLHLSVHVDNFERNNKDPSY